MDDRTLVRAGESLVLVGRFPVPYVRLMFVAFVGLAHTIFVTAAIGRQSDQSEPETSAAERPYQIRTWLTVDPASRVGPRQAKDLVDGWLVLVDRFVGLPWEIELIRDPGPTKGLDLNQIQPELIAASVAGADKGWFLRIEPAELNAGFAIEGREYDVLTGELGPLYRQDAPYPSDAARSLFELSQRLFAPVAEIEGSEGKTATITIQGAALPASSPTGRIVEQGSVFRPFRIFLTSEGEIEQIASVPFTYLKVARLNGSEAQAEIVSGLRSPLPRRIAGRYRQVALGVSPANLTTSFQFVAGLGEEAEPVAGYVVTARELDERAPREIGTTNRDGMITLPPMFSDELVILRLLAAGIEPLREVPVLPGETAEVRRIPVVTKPEAVALEFRLLAMQDQLVDLVARRGRLEAALDARSAGGNWDDVEELLEQYRELPSKDSFVDQLESWRQQASQTQREQRVPVLTPTAQAELRETQALIERYLGDEAYNAYSEALRRARSPQGSTTPTQSSGSLEQRLGGN